MSERATPEEIRSAYRAGATRLHPDRGGHPSQFRALRRAYDVLADPDQRSAYDADLTASRRPAPDQSAAPDAEPTWGEEAIWTEDEPAETASGSNRPPEPPPSSPTFEPQRDVGESSVSDHGEAEVPIRSDLRVEPPLDQHRLAARTAVGLWIAALAGLVVAATIATGPAGLQWLGLLLPVAAIAVPAGCRSGGLGGVVRVASIIGWIELALFAALIVGTSSGQNQTVGLVILGSVLVAAVVVRAVAAARCPIRKLNRLVGRQTAYEHNLFGRPGEQWGPGVGQAPAHLSMSAAELLEDLLVIPGSKLVNSPRWDDGTQVVGDQGLACGSRIALVQVQQWRRGRYRLDSYGNVVSAGSGERLGPGVLVQAVSAVQSGPGVSFRPRSGRVPPITARGFVLVFGVEDLWLEAGDVAYVSADRAVEMIGGWLRPEAGRVDRWLLAAVLR